ncbi:MAG TPA: hypothetical protein PKA76_10775, partial [Pirellulaceae bacterium]|nr:hypothetical protein [Pirellulaceae bacterium]
GRVADNDREPMFDMLNGGLAVVLQFSLALIPIFALCRLWTGALIWVGIASGIGLVLYFTWYRNLPPWDEEQIADRKAANA